MHAARCQLHVAAACNGQMHAGPPHPSNEGYAYAKRLLDVNCRLHNEQYGTNYVTLIPTNMFGCAEDRIRLAVQRVLASRQLCR